MRSDHRRFHFPLFFLFFKATGDKGEKALLARLLTRGLAKVLAQQLKVG